MKKRFFKLIIFLNVPPIALICFYLVNDLFSYGGITSLLRKQRSPYDACVGPWVANYRRFHKDSLSNLDNSTRFLGYWCGGTGYACGGFGNRIYGIISVFYLAILTNRVFFIHWGGPERLDDFLMPKAIDWRIKPDEMGTTMRKRRWGDFVGSVAGMDNSISRGESESTFYKWIGTEADIDFLFHERLESMETIWFFAEHLERNPHLRARWRVLGLPESTDPYKLIGCGMDFLFRKSSYMEKQLSKAKDKLQFSNQHPVIGIHIRTNDHHWGDQHPDNERTRNVENVRNCAQQVENALKSRHHIENQITWFLASDRVAIKFNWTKRPPLTKVVTQDFIPTHSEKHASKTTLTNTLTDLFLLCECDFLIGTRYSTFSNVAIGIGKFPAMSWVYGEYCDKLNNKTWKLP